MEINPPSQDNSDHVVLISDTTYDEDHHHQQQQQQHQQQQGGQKSQVRSYECTFCKRGFSNAQALGGHMNIHRKDKAKLKQSPSNPTPNHLPPKNWPWIFSDPKSIDRATPTMFRHGQSTTGSTTHFGQHHQFPWYSETSRFGNQESGGRGFFASSSQEKVVMGEDNLDLELRLGHGPSHEDHSPGATGMMKFL